MAPRWLFAARQRFAPLFPLLLLLHLLLPLLGPPCQARVLEQRREVNMLTKSTSSRRREAVELEAMRLRSLKTSKPKPPKPPKPAKPPHTVYDPVNGVYDVTSMGAAGDGISNDGPSIMSALRAACAALQSGHLRATVLLPKNRTFYLGEALELSGPCVPKSSSSSSSSSSPSSSKGLSRGGGPTLRVQIDGTVLFPQNPDVIGYPAALIHLRKFPSLEIGGAGKIDGRGKRYWERFWAGNKRQRPRIIQVEDISERLEVFDITLKDSPKFILYIDRCRNVWVHGVRTDCPWNSPNTDSIHLKRVTGAVVEDVLLHAGDDCVSISYGTSDVLVQNLTCTAGHGISIGSLGAGGETACVHNVTVLNSYLQNCTSGLRIKTYFGGHGCVRDVRYENISLVDVGNPIDVNQSYCDLNNVGASACVPKTGAVSIFNVTYRNISGTTRTMPEGNGTEGIHFDCSVFQACGPLFLDNINIKSAIGSVALTPFYQNAYGRVANLISPLSPTGDGLLPPPMHAADIASIRKEAAKCSFGMPSPNW